MAQHGEIDEAAQQLLARGDYFCFGEQMLPQLGVGAGRGGNDVGGKCGVGHGSRSFRRSCAGARL